jgi:hypothetical protein
LLSAVCGSSTTTIDFMNPIHCKRSITAAALGVAAVASNTAVAGGMSLQ